MFSLQPGISFPLSSASSPLLCQQAGENIVIPLLSCYFSTSPTLPRTAHTIGVQASLTLPAHIPPPFPSSYCWHTYIPLKHLHDAILHLQSSLITLSSTQKDVVPLLAATDYFNIWLLKYQKIESRVSLRRLCTIQAGNRFLDEQVMQTHYNEWKTKRKVCYCSLCHLFQNRVRE